MSWLSMRRLVPLVLGTAALALVWGRFAVEAHRAMGDAHAAVAGGDRAEAVRCYLDALRVYVPGSPYERRALDGLEGLAAEARQAGDATGERQALQAIRSGLMGTRSLFVPYRGRLAGADARLQELDAAAGVAPPVELLGPRGHHGPGRVSVVRGSAVLSTLIALVGLGTWIAAVVLLVRLGIEDRSPRESAPAAGAATAEAVARAPGLRLLVTALFVVGVVLFLAGLRFT